jgi:uncharacterized protein DUF998
MADTPDPRLFASQPALSGGDLTPARPLSRSLLILLTCGTVGGLLYTAIYLIEGAIRPDYDAWQQTISALSLGPGGWVQQVDFVFFGLVTIALAFIWRQILKGGVGATWYPIMRGLEGLALIGAGFFSVDPAPGYPKGAILTSTLHGTIHTMCALVVITSIAIGYFVLARRFAQEPRWGRGWAVYSIISGLLTLFLFAIFLNEPGSAIAGLIERLATSGVSRPFDVIVLVRVWLGVGFTSPGLSNGVLRKEKGI